MSGEKQQKKKKLWGGRFTEQPSGITEELSASIRYDSRLYKQDIRGSIAHARMLNKIGIINDRELEDIVRGLREIQRDIDEGRFTFSSALEDIHMNIESRLTEMIGDAGKKLHTARSRNDQVSLDLRLYIIDEAGSIDAFLKKLIGLLCDLAEENIELVMPGYTHMQVAQPVRLSHYLMAHGWALERDRGRLAGIITSCNYLPLGSGALAGVNYPSDRDFIRKELGLSDITSNSMDTVSDRDFALECLFFASMLGMHLSRFCEELVLWSSSEFGFIRLADEVTTGSSIMPQKRNPDLAELIRGKTGRLYGNLVSLLTTMKSLPLAYNRDLQEDKEPLFDSLDTVKLSLRGMIEMLSTVTFNGERMREAISKNFSTATDLADYLVQKGVPFRKAHEIVGNIVKYCESEGVDFFTLKSEKLQEFTAEFDQDSGRLLSPEQSTERKVSAGGTSRMEVIRQIDTLRKRLEV